MQCAMPPSSCIKAFLNNSVNRLTDGRNNIKEKAFLLLFRSSVKHTQDEPITFCVYRIIWLAGNVLVLQLMKAGHRCRVQPARER